MQESGHVFGHALWEKPGKLVITLIVKTSHAISQTIMHFPFFYIGGELPRVQKKIALSVLSCGRRGPFRYFIGAVFAKVAGCEQDTEQQKANRFIRFCQPSKSDFLTLFSPAP